MAGAFCWPLISSHQSLHNKRPRIATRKTKEKLKIQTRAIRGDSPRSVSSTEASWPRGQSQGEAMLCRSTKSRGEYRR